MPVDLQKVVREIYRLANALGMSPPNATRLVKLVYLVDLEWPRSHEGEPLSDLHWRFHHYGPYASEFSDLLGGDDVEEIEFAEGKTARRLVFSDDDLRQEEVPAALSSLLQKVVKAWGDTNLNVLLNHVYCNTEPMDDAKRGEELDFSGVKPHRVLKLNLDPKAIAKLRADLSQHIRSQKELYRPTVDLGGWDDDEDTRTPRLPIGARVNF